MDTENFWKRVKDQAKAHKISLEKFAEYINVPKSTFFRWKKNNLVPDVVTSYNIATALGVSLEYLLTGKKQKGEEERMAQIKARKNTEARVKKLVEKLQEEVLKF